MEIKGLRVYSKSINPMMDHNPMDRICIADLVHFVISRVEKDGGWVPVHQQGGSVWVHGFERCDKRSCRGNLDLFRRDPLTPHDGYEPEIVEQVEEALDLVRRIQELETRLEARSPLVLKLDGKWGKGDT